MLGDWHTDFADYSLQVSMLGDWRTDFADYSLQVPTWLPGKIRVPVPEI
jgi:hypothetical protein